MKNKILGIHLSTWYMYVLYKWTIYIYMFYKRLYTMYTHGEFYIEIISTNSTLKKSRGGK